MDINPQIIFAVLIGMFIVIAILAFCVVIVLAVQKKPPRNPPLIPKNDGHFEVGGKRVTCSHCGGTSFKSQEILLNTWLLSLLRIDWLDSSSTVLACDKCGKLTWFAQEE